MSACCSTSGVAAAGVLHTAPDSLTTALGVVVLVGTVGGALLCGLAVAAFVRRRSRPYLLVVGAFAALFVRSGVAVATLFGGVDPATHHLVEHGVDIVLVALVIAAVYDARNARREVSAS